MSYMTPREILDWLWDHNLMEAACVYDGRDRWRDAYHGSSHKACLSRTRGYLYNIDNDFTPHKAIVPTGGVVLTLGEQAMRAFDADPNLALELKSAIGASAIERLPEDPDTYIISFAA